MFKSLSDFISKTPDAGSCTSNVANVLKERGFIELDEKISWDPTRKFVRNMFVIRGSSIIAIKLPKNFKGFRGVLTHSDSPHFKIKLNPEISQNGYTKLNVEPYGGAIYYSWLDKPLSICGTLVTKEGRKVSVDTGSKLQVFIPSQAIHINREVNKANELNPQKDMLPVCSLSEHMDFLKRVCEIAGIEEKNLLTCDLSLYNPEPVKTVDMVDFSVLMGPRLDNLSSVYSALDAFVADDNKTEYAQVFVAFNSEEIGSMTFDGADSNFLTSVLERICNLHELDKYAVFANSSFLNVDAAHAVHPNAPEKSDPTNIVKLNEGVVVKHNVNYANDVELEAHIKRIFCNKFGKDIKPQDFYSKSDMRCGSTLGNISMSHHGIKTLDIGIPMLAMHSAVETICDVVIYELRSLLYHYYQS